MNIIKKFLEIIVSLFFKIFFRFHRGRVISKNLKKATSFYKNGDFSDLFAKIRAWDAPYEDIERLVPKNGRIVDLGSGDGLLANFLGLSSRGRNVFAIELNKERFQKANHGVKNVRFMKGNILKVPIPKNDCTLLVHVLHHLSSKKDQEDLLRRIYASLTKGGKLIVVEVGEKPFLKLIFSWLTDAITVPIIFESKLFDLNFHYRKAKEWRVLLSSYGFNAQIRKAHKGMPFSHIVFDCTKM